jgi:hypothetical protein
MQQLSSRRWSPLAQASWTCGAATARWRTKRRCAGRGRAGWLKYDHVESLPDGRYRFSLANDCSLEDADQFKRTLTEEQGLGVEAVGEVPEVLTREMSWAEYEAQPRPKDAPSPATFEGRIELHRETAPSRWPSAGATKVHPPDTGALIVSLHGDKTRLKRRAEAESAIRGQHAARCPNSDCCWRSGR